jgi:hypothetical protein
LINRIEHNPIKESFSNPLRFNVEILDLEYVQVDLSNVKYMLSGNAIAQNIRALIEVI